MTTMPAATGMTADEFLALPLDSDEYGFAPCLVEGELVVNHPTMRHQRVALNVVRALANWVDPVHERGVVTMPVAVRLDERNVYAPDILWYSAARRPLDESAASYPVPDLAVEVHSPSTWRYDTGAKKAEYERHGLRELWLIDTPAREVLVFRRSRPDAAQFDIALKLAVGDTLESPLLGGFAPALDELFRS